jgi:hypothetical protein
MMSEKKAVITVGFVSQGGGKCRWCKKERESGIYEVAFSDGSFTGLYCWKDLQRAVDDRTPERRPTQATIPMPPQVAKA